MPGQPNIVPWRVIGKRKTILTRDAKQSDMTNK